jgi:hypothetical protein
MHPSGTTGCGVCPIAAGAVSVHTHRTNRARDGPGACSAYWSGGFVTLSRFYKMPAKRPVSFVSRIRCELEFGEPEGAMRIGVAGMVVLILSGSTGIGTIAAGRTLSARSGRIDSLAWLSGCWSRSGQRGMTEEQWTRPAGGTMLGLSRTVRRVADRDSTTEFEFLRIFARDERLVYAALPSGQRYTEFIETEATDSSVVFANPRHDFPQYVRYTRRGADSLIARIDGTIQGRARAVDFPYARASCR